MIKNCQIVKAQQDINNIVYRGRVLWRDIATWLNAYLMAKTLQGDTELLEQIKDKLLRIVEDFGGMMRTFFGEKAAEDYISLFSEYIMLMISLIDALVEGNSSAADEIVKQIYESSIRNYERILSYSTSLGDFLAEGIKDYLIYNMESPTTVQPPTVE